MEIDSYHSEQQHVGMYHSLNTIVHFREPFHIPMAVAIYLHLIFILRHIASSAADETLWDLGEFHKMQ